MILIQEETGVFKDERSIVEVQYHGKNMRTTDIEKLVKEDVKSQGVKISTVDTLQIYYTPKISFDPFATTKMVNL